MSVLEKKKMFGDDETSLFFFFLDIVIHFPFRAAMRKDRLQIIMWIGGEGLASTWARVATNLRLGPN